MKYRYLAAFEISSSKIKGAVAAVADNSEMRIVAVEEERATDIVHYGCVIKPADVLSHIKSIREKLESNPELENRKIEMAVVSLGGQSLMSTVKAIELKFPGESIVGQDTIRELKTRAISTGVSEREVVKVQPRDFIVDGRAVSNPLGMYCREIRANMNVVYCNPQLKINLNRVFENLKDGEERLNVIKYPVRPIAIANIVLSNEEKSLGCMLVDFGAETTTVSIYKNDSLRYLVTLPLGSRHITRDIMAFRSCLESDAEEFKCRKANIDPDHKEENPEVEAVNRCIYARAGEIIANIVKQLDYAGIKAEELPRGIVLIGGGAKLVGFDKVLSQESGLEVRAGSTVMSVDFMDISQRQEDNIDVISLLAHASALRDKPDMLSAPIVEEEKPDDTPRIGEEEGEDKVVEKIKDDEPNIFASTLLRIKKMFVDEDED